MAGPNAIRLLVSDIDGTLVRSDKTLSDAVVEAVAKVRQAGVPVTLISARPPSGMLWIAERLALTGPIGAFNGGTIAMPDGRIVSADRLAPDIAARTLAMLDRPGVTPWLFADGHWYAQDGENRNLPRERLAANVDPIFQADFTPLLGRVDKLVGVSDDHPLLAAIEGEMKAALGDGANVVRSQPYYLDVTAPSANKGDGIAALAKAYDVSLSAVAAMGDQYNDLPMFARAGLSVAMGQAPADVQSAADHVAKTNQDDGVADAITRFVLPALAG
ncbi:Cof-type HAD-IIB family hydrolase [Sphingomonas sp. S2-65]|uniref:Cof-type HAD-IIB family hydrolase n=1 Tax=Sphingomonas sp. S2-65 TaxID=2903960 RepID=UPI001F348478|nr:Cof-type HAD-IIB family hydrolase [Sphingomonas sp. S2-65]UYY59360.1 Cof-type HAD-IIB family hydrolase [Sphingomonas sp. S2-65]